MKKSKKSNRKYKNSKGITLIPLIITVLLMMILVGVALTNGLQSADNVQLQKFFRELQIIQKRVDVIAEEAKAGSNSYITYNSETFTSNIGTAVTDEIISEVDDATGYYLYSSENLKQLGIEGINQSVYINWATRDVVSKDGFTANGTIYYRDDSTFKPEYQEVEKKQVSFDIDNNIEITGTSIKRVEIVNLKTTEGEEITDFEVKYKLQDEEILKETTDNSFQTAIPGKYDIQISRSTN